MEENNKDNNNKDNNNNKKPGGYNGMIGVIIIAVILAIIFMMSFNNYRSAGEQEISYNRFIEMLEDGEVKDVEIYENKIRFSPSGDSKVTENVTYYVYRTDDYKLIDRLEEADVKFVAINEGGNAILGQVLYYVIMIALFYFITMMIMRRITSGSGGIMNVGKSNAKMYDMKKNTGVTFKDVAGEEEAKESLTEMVDFLKNPGRYIEIGARLPKGALLVGPPGTGKTLLAKAVAGEAGVPFFSISGSEFVEMYVGVGASRVRDLFKQANAKAPCIIFIDEIDAIGRSRDTRHMGGDSEREQTLNQLLSEMDGFDSSKGIIILAATNRPEVLDKALLRPGRFDRRVIVERPDQKGREDILRVHSKNVKLDETVDLHELANVTSGSVGADLENIINEAALTAVRKGRRFVAQQDLIESVEIVFAGKEKKDRVLSLEEKSIVAYHEAGHALLTMLQKNTMPVQKITIVPRTMGALGYVWQTPEEEKYLESKAEMEAHIVITMGGRAAEALRFASVTSGASNDIEQATKEARAMVTMYGMSERFGMVQLEDITGEYLDRRSVQTCSDETATKIDEEVQKILNNAYARAYKILSDNIKILDAIAGYLIDHESITGKEFMSIFEQVTGGITPQIDKNVSLTAGDLSSQYHVSRFGIEDPADGYVAPKTKKQSKVEAYYEIGQDLSQETKKQKTKKNKTQSDVKINAKINAKSETKDKVSKNSDKKAAKEKKKKKEKDKHRVFVSDDFKEKRDALLNDDYDSLDSISDNTVSQTNKVANNQVEDISVVNVTETDESINNTLTENDNSISYDNSSDNSLDSEAISDTAIDSNIDSDSTSDSDIKRSTSPVIIDLGEDDEDDDDDDEEDFEEALEKESDASVNNQTENKKPWE
ncbi:MAG: ATP-dependent zinc metalloprotease FtsH [Eubacterium sp.]|nr:ATP-dependent zinc metalloprotease FtsH [Eubacterium sp.]